MTASAEAPEAGAVCAAAAASSGSGPARLPKLMEIVAAARSTVAFFTELPVDAVSSCLRRGEEWVIRVDVIEARARLGDNDLIASYEVALAPCGTVLGLSRVARYRRDDAAGGRT